MAYFGPQRSPASLQAQHMRLKQLDIKGFKSFANETVINFEEDVIGIVGPNGSGKSNIVDAIRWVLGEQKSRELRLDTMSSVIFNGTKRRKAGGIASVSLTFENTKNLLPTEYHTLTITRILYRNGDSEYRLNGVPCRLKDITSLFLDTGIGSNSYAIIALGMVDDILADKDNSRRKMFEQAAGISKYKVRKRETLNKLKSTTEDLDRVEDLLHEIQNNLKSLEKQAKRARRYFEIKAQYKEYSTELALLSIGSLKEQQNSLRKQLEQEEDAYRQHDVGINQLEAVLEQERKANLDKEQALSNRQRELNSLVGNIRGMENDKRMQQQKQQFLNSNLSKLAEDIHAAEARIRQLNEDIGQYREDLNGEKRIEARLEEELNEAEEALARIRKDHGSLKAGLDQVVEEQQKLDRQVFELEKQKAINTNQIESGKREAARGREEIDRRNGEVNGLQEKIRVLETREQELQLGLSELEKAEEERLSELEKTEEQIEQLNKQRVRVSRTLDARRNEFKLTQSMVESLEGFPESIKFLSTTKSPEWDKATPLLSDLIYVEEAYRVAIENFLEPYLNYYVVPDLEAAYRAIQLLNKTQKGKANFFLLDAFASYVPPVVMLPGTQRATDLVKTDPEYRNLIAFLLEQVLVTDSEEIQGPVSEAGYVLLAKSGRFIQRQYSISGGSIGLFEGKKIGRKKNLEVLEEEIRQLEKEDDKLSDRFHSLKGQLGQLKAQQGSLKIQQEQRMLNQVLQEKTAIAARLDNFESFLAEAQERLQAQGRQMEELQADNEDIDGQLRLKRFELSQVKARIADTDVSYRDVAEQLSAAATAFNEKNISFIKQQNKVSALQRELSFRERQLDEAGASIQANKEKEKTSKQEIQELQGQADELEQKLLTAYSQRKEREERLTQAEQAYYKTRGGINEMEDRLRQLNKKRQDAQILVNTLKDKVNDVKYKVSAVAQRMRIEFNIDINEILQLEPKLGIEKEELQLKTERLRGRLENYGEVNPMAVEAYDEMKARSENITQQRDDILQAKDDLEATIKEIEETATQQFLESFDKARLYFIDVFRSLFTIEDTCDLVLLDPDNPLESKIEIVAKPKGKRPQTISQLSGGEKTLTATALLFALYLLKPAPFCIFDEVDAPLDDANIEKFNKIIKKFSKDSQFIIVTHNKLTMAAVDTIYGVYMAEQGVSGVSPVDFRDFDHAMTFEVREEN